MFTRWNICWINKTTPDLFSPDPRGRGIFLCCGTLSFGTLSPHLPSPLRFAFHLIPKGEALICKIPKKAPSWRELSPQATEGVKSLFLRREQSTMGEGERASGRGVFIIQNKSPFLAQNQKGGRIILLRSLQKHNHSIPQNQGTRRGSY